MKNFEKTYMDIITESSITRIMNYINKFECAAISASRNKLTNITNKTLIDKEPESFYTKEDNKKRNNLLKACLLKFGYGVTALTGKYAEAGEVFPGRETSYFIVNINDDSNFYNNCFILSEKFNQDSFLYKPKDTNNAYIIGTNMSERNEANYTPGYNQRIFVGEFHPNGFEGALSKIGSKIFQFRLNENKQQNRTFIGSKILVEETFNNLTNIQKYGCLNSFKQLFK